MLTLVADANIEGQVNDLLAVLKNSEWRGILDLLDVELLRLVDFGLSHDASDRVVWNTMQKYSAILITANRNDDGIDSRHATIDDSNQITSLPVITVSKAEKLHASRDYASKCADRLMDYLIDLEYYRGTGRLYIP